MKPQAIKGVPADTHAWLLSQLRHASMVRRGTLKTQVPSDLEDTLRSLLSSVPAATWSRLTALEAKHKSFVVRELVAAVARAEPEFPFLPRGQPSKAAAIAAQIEGHCLDAAKLMRDNRRLLEERAPDLFNTIKLLEEAAQLTLTNLEKPIFDSEVRELLERQQQALQEQNIERYVPEPPSLFEALAHVATRPAVAKSRLIPRKVNQATAPRTRAVLVASEYFKRTTGQPHHRLVADLVNVSTRVQDVQMLDDTSVRQLVKATTVDR